MCLIVTLKTFRRSIPHSYFFKTMKTIFGYCFFFFCLYPCFSQPKTSKVYTFKEIDSLSYAYQAKGQFKEGLELAKEIVEATKDKDVALYVHALYFLAQFEEANSLYKQAEATCHKLLSIIEKKEGKSTVYAETLQLLAKISYFMGELQKAELYFVEVCTIIEKQKGKDNAYYANALSMLGAIYITNHKLEEAEEALVEAKVLVLKFFGRMHEQYTSILNYLTLLYEQQHKVALAIESAKEALEIQKKLNPNDLMYTHRLSELARLYGRYNQPHLAEPMVLEVLEIRQKTIGEKNHYTLRALVQYASVKRYQEKYLEGLNYTKQVFRLNTTSELDTITWERLLDTLDKVDLISFEILGINLKLTEVLLKDLYAKTANKKWLELLYLLYKTENKINNKVRNSFRTEGDKLRLTKDNVSLAQKGIEIALQLNCPDCMESAFLFAEQNKSRLLDEVIHTNKAKTFGRLPEELLKREQELQGKIAKLRAELAVLTSDNQEDKEIVGRLNAVGKEITEFQQKLEETYPKYYQAKYNKKSLSLSNIQQTLKEDQLLLEYLVTPLKVYVFVVEQQKMDVVELPIKQEHFNHQVRRLRLALSDYDFICDHPLENQKQYCSTAHWFYQQLVDPILKKQSANRVKQLIIIPDGELGHLPFEVFLLNEPDTLGDFSYNDLEYLFQKYQISYNYSASLWWNNQNKTTSVPNGRILAYAAGYSKRLNYSYLPKKVSGRLLDIRKKLNALPASIEEVKTLSKGFEGTFRIKEEATEANFKQDLAEHDIVHLAMHGVLDKEYPLLSSFAFSEVGDSLEDNFLQAYEISQMDIKAKLVVLSACETGFGKFEQGEGVMSLARSFMYAGVPSLVVSLWQINDLSTAVIMRKFYQELSKGTSKSVALQQAKKAYLKRSEGLAAHPIFWASFIQLGDDRPVVLYKKNTVFWWLVFIGGMVGIFLIGRWLLLRKEL